MQRTAHSMPPCHCHQTSTVSLQEQHKKGEEVIIGILSTTSLPKVVMSPVLILTVAAHVQ